MALRVTHLGRYNINDLEAFVALNLVIYEYSSTSQLRKAENENTSRAT